MSAKYYNWNPDKNDLLKKKRGLSLEDIVFHIMNGDEVDVLPHPNQERYPNQRISVVNVSGYIYLVPFVESENELFLKTIIPSRKATRQYLGGAK